MDIFELERPDHVEDPAWEAVEVARNRLSEAWDRRDCTDVVGKAKELVETIAKVVLTEAGDTVGDSADYPRVVKNAHSVLKRQPGPDLSSSSELKGMAQAAQTLATSLAPLRNKHGTGHGRARVPRVDIEMASVCMESAMLWSRWALRRLGCVLADYPNDLIDAVQSATGRSALHEKFVAATLSDQPEEIQRKIGVTFGQQSAGGFGNATAVGVDPAIDGGFEEYPVDYRNGLLEGMMLTDDGAVGLTDFFAPRFVSLLASLPESAARCVLHKLQRDVTDAPWQTTWRGSTSSPADLISGLTRERVMLQGPILEDFDELCSLLQQSANGGT